MDVVRVGVAPYAHLHPECYPPSKTRCDVGVEVDILEAVLKMAKLKMQLVVSKETGSCGKTPLDTGSQEKWSGLLKMLRDGEIDITGNLCGVNKLAQFDQNFFSMSWQVWQYREQYVIQVPEPPPLTFAPMTPFSIPVWIAYAITFLVYLSFVLLYSYVKYGSVHKFIFQVFHSAIILVDAGCSFGKKAPLKLMWPLWFVLLTTLFIFYKTFILSAVLHPFPIWRPFSNSLELVDALATEKYRLLTYRNPPSFPGGCTSADCRSKFNGTIKNIKYMANSNGGDLLPAIVDQDPQSASKLVLVQGMPFVDLYLSEFPKERNRLWIIDTKDSFEQWSAFLWRKNFTHAKKLNFYLTQIGDFKLNALAKYVRPFGVRPQTGEKISEATSQVGIGLYRFRGLFFMLFGGLGAAILVLLIEICKDHSESGLTTTRVHPF